MPNLITVNRKLKTQALLEIENPDFAHWYGLGVWWAMYGDGQGNGPYDDQYLFDTIISHIQSGWYDDLASIHFPAVGFYLGMIHGGMIDPYTLQLHTSASLVILTDPDFTKGYHVGREYFFFEAPPEEHPMTDTFLVETIHSWALEYCTWKEPEECLRYVLGCRIGALSGELLPMGEEERMRIEEEHYQALAEHEMASAAQLQPTT